jgi:hypothetical protein
VENQFESANFFSKYTEEVKKHDETKKALNKAIHLANLLLDEISQEN